MAMTIEQQRALALARARQRAQQVAPEIVHRGNILPIDRDTAGGLHFNIHSGLTGAVENVFKPPGFSYEQMQTDPAAKQEAVEWATNAAMVASPVNPAVRSGERAIAGVTQALRRQSTPAPTAEALRAAGAEGFDKARDMGVDYAASSVAQVASALRANLEKEGVLAELAPKSFSIIKKLETPPSGSTGSLAGLHAARRAFNNAAKDFANPTEQLAAKQAVGELDKFIQTADPATVVAGPAAAAGETFGEALGNYAASKRSDRLTGVEDAADLRAAAANSGRNLDNSVRQRIASLLLNPKARAGYSPEEIAAIEKITMGTVVRNRVRDIGNYAGGGGGRESAVASGVGGVLGYLIGGPEWAAIAATATPAIGTGARTAANAMTRRSLSRADELVRMRSPLYEQMQEEAPSVAAPTAMRAAMLKALLLSMENRKSGGF